MKRALLGAWLVVFAAWPLVQHQLVGRYGLDAWKFAGWATFAVPALPPTVLLFQIDYRQAKTLDEIRATKLMPAYWSANLRDEVKRYTTARTNFGLLVPKPEQLGRKLLDEHGDTGMVLVVVQTREIDRSTGLMKTNLERHVFSTDKAKAEAGTAGSQP